MFKLALLTLALCATMASAYNNGTHFYCECTDEWIPASWVSDIQPPSPSFCGIHLYNPPIPAFRSRRFLYHVHP